MSEKLFKFYFINLWWLNAFKVKDFTVKSLYANTFDPSLVSVFGQCLKHRLEESSQFWEQNRAENDRHGMARQFSVFPCEHFPPRNRGGRKNSPNFSKLLRHFSLLNVTKPKAKLKSVTHFDSLHRISDLDSDYASTLRCSPDKCSLDRCSPDKCSPDKCSPDKCSPDKCFPDKNSLL